MRSAARARGSSLDVRGGERSRSIRRLAIDARAGDRASPFRRWPAASAADLLRAAPAGRASRSSSTRPTSCADIDNPYWPMTPGTTVDVEEVDVDGAEPEGRGHGAVADEGHRRDHGHRRARHGHRGRRARRGHVRLVRAGHRAATSGTSARTRRSTRTARSSSTAGSWETGVDGGTGRRDRPRRA